jgi:hypothetical protein
MLAFWAEYRQSVVGIEDDMILNMDETSLAYDVPARRAYARRGAKTVCLRTSGKEKNTVTIALCVSRAGNKLKPFIIYRGNALSTLIIGERSGRISGELSSQEYGTTTVRSVAPKAWMDNGQMRIWIRTVFYQALTFLGVASISEWA